MFAMLASAVALAAGMLLHYLGGRFIRRAYRRGRLRAQYVPLLESALRWGLLFAVAIVCLRAAGVSGASVTATLSAVAMVAAVAFFAYWSVLSNGLCSLLLLLFAPFRVGDEIEVLENENNRTAKGRVVGINLLYVSLRYVDETNAESTFRVPANLFFQRTVRVRHGDETKSLGEAYQEIKEEKR